MVGYPVATIVCHNNKRTEEKINNYNYKRPHSIQLLKTAADRLVKLNLII